MAAGFLARSFFELDAESAKATGAHMFSTDFPDENAFSDGSPVHCNPVSGNEHCTAADLEEPAFIGR